MKYLLLVLLILSALAFMDKSHAFSSPCVESVCQKIGNLECEQPSVLLDITRVCQQNPSLACFDYVSQQAGGLLGSWPQVKRFLLACRQNEGDQCVQSYTYFLGELEMDSPNNLINAATSCQRVDSNCLRTTCERLGLGGCDTFPQINRVAYSCRYP